MLRKELGTLDDRLTVILRDWWWNRSRWNGFTGIKKCAYSCVVCERIITFDNDQSHCEDCGKMKKAKEITFD